MATYDSSLGGAAIPFDMKSNGGFFKLKRSFTAATLRAEHTTPTTDGYFTANDIIKLMDFPAGCLFMWSIFNTVVAGTTAAANCDLGLAGGVEFNSALNLDETAGTVIIQSITDTAIDDHYSAADTADLQVTGQTWITGSYIWSLLGNHGC